MLFAELFVAAALTGSIPYDQAPVCRYNHCPVVRRVVAAAVVRPVVKTAKAAAASTRTVVRASRQAVATPVRRVLQRGSTCSLRGG